MKRQLNLRISDLARNQIAELQEALNVSKTELVTLALDRLYQAEISSSQITKYRKEATK